MLRTGLIRIDRGKVASVESDMGSVTLRHVTPIMADLAAGVLMPIHTCRPHAVPMPCRALNSHMQYPCAPMPFPCHAVPLIHT